MNAVRGDGLVPGVLMGMASRNEIRVLVTMVDVGGVDVVVRVHGVGHDAAAVLTRKPCRAPCRQDANDKPKAESRI
ncbi:MAG: hypothetical protein ACKO9H_17260 [Planctomycetota bacterium]